jgi:hypothetical protein
MHVFELRPRKGSSRFRSNLGCAAIPSRVVRLGQRRVQYTKLVSRSHDAVIRVYDEAGNVIETHEHVGDCKEW